MILSVNGLPSKFRGKCNITISEAKVEACTRNVLLLLVFSSFPPEQAAEIAIHLWYSANLPHGVSISLKPILLSKLKDNIFRRLPIISSKEIGAAPFTGNFKLGVFAEMKATLTVLLWSSLSHVLMNETTTDKAMKKRNKKLLDKTQIDIQERELYDWRPYHRVARGQFDDDGLVLPFGVYRKHFTDPNL